MTRWVAIIATLTFLRQKCQTPVNRIPGECHVLCEPHSVHDLADVVPQPFAQSMSIDVALVAGCLAQYFMQIRYIIGAADQVADFLWMDAETGLLHIQQTP